MAEKLDASKVECELELIRLKTQLDLKQVEGRIVENELTTFEFKLFLSDFSDMNVNKDKF